MNTFIQRYEKNQNGRDFVVGDIHGHGELLFVALAQLCNGEGLHQPFDFNKDRLFSVGDLVDRGPDSAHVVSLLAEPWFFAIKGNHEDMAIRWYDRTDPDYATMPIADWPMDAGSYVRNGGQWFLDLNEAGQLLVINSIRHLPLAIELETDEGLLGIIHAEVRSDDWHGLYDACEGYIPGKYSKHFKAVEEEALWARDKIQQERSWDTIKGIDAVVCGHTPLKMPVVMGNQMYIDTMGWRPDKGGVFTIIEAKEIIRAVRDGL